MCSAPSPPPYVPPKQRAMARAPQRVVPNRPSTQGAGSTRSTVVNQNPDAIRRAMTAQLGGARVTLGG